MEKVKLIETPPKPEIEPMFPPLRRRKAEKKPNSVERATIEAIKKGHPTEKQVAAVVEDIEEHLQTVTGTLSNYVGRYGNATAKRIAKKWHFFLPNDDIVTYKKNEIMEFLAQKILANQRINVHPALIKMVLDHIGVPKEEVQDNRYIVVGQYLEANLHSFDDSPYKMKKCRVENGRLENLQQEIQSSTIETLAKENED